MSDKEKTNGSLAMAPRVITIPAANQETARKLRVAAYTRVSSNSKDQEHSFAAQNAYFSKLITDNPDWELADIYADQGITGTSIDKRDDFLRMMEDCRKGRIDRILVKSSSRFARNTKESLAAVRELKSLNISVYFEEQNIDTAQVSGEVLIAMFAALAQRESEAISERVRWSYKVRMSKGRFSTCKAPYGKKYCKESPTLDESPLQQAVLAAINASMSGCKVLADQLVDAMEQELAPIPGESMSLGDIDRAVTELGKQFDTLLAEAANGDADEYAERFRTISTTMEELKRRKAAILGIRQEQEQISRRIHAAASAMTAATVGITEWDDGVVYQMLEKVTVLTGNRIKVTFRNGVEIEQTVDQPKRRKFI